MSNITFKLSVTVDEYHVTHESEMKIPYDDVGNPDTTAKIASWAASFAVASVKKIQDWFQAWANAR